MSVKPAGNRHVGIDPQSVRPSAFAGTWYPGSPGELAETVDAMLAEATFQPTSDELVALISPHAGYAYSGPTAAFAYRQLEGRMYDLVILLGPSHSGNFGPFSISSKQYYATPLGEIELDQDFIDKLASQVTLTRVERDREHSLEIQLPFLQRMLGDFRLVPIMMLTPLYLLGSAALGMCEGLATALAKVAQGRKVLFVASSDLSHLEDYRLVDQFDRRTAELVESFDIPRLVEHMSEKGECRACGDAPILTMFLAAQQSGAHRAEILRRTHSADVTGLYSPGQYTVGYMAAALYKSPSRE